MALSYQKPVSHAHKENRPLGVFICGLHSAGKTTVFYCTKFDKPIPIMTLTLGLEMESIVVDNISVAVMDLGGRSRIRAMQHIYYRGTSGIIFVVDSNDRTRIDETREELHRMSNVEELLDKPFLILANKQDLSTAMTVDELRDVLNLSKFEGNRKWHLQPASAIRNEGFHEGLKWLANAMVEKVDSMKPIVETLNDTITIKNYLKSILNMTNVKTFLNKFV